MKVNVNLNLKNSNNAEVLVEADHYTGNMTGNVTFAAADIVAQVTVTKTAITNLRNALNAPTSDTKTDNVKIAREAVDRNLTILAAKVEIVANDMALADDKRIAVIHGAGMNAKGQANAQRRKFTVSNTDIKGQVHLTAQGGANANEWQYTTDILHFTGRQAADTTTTAQTEIDGLKSVTEYAFFHKAILAGEKTDWEGPIIMTVS